MNKIAWNLLWSYAERFLNKIISLVVQIILARLLLPADYGTIAMIMVIISLFDVLINDGFCNALVQKKEIDKGDYDSIFWLNVCISLTLYLCLFCLADYIGVFLNDGNLPALIRFMGLVLIVSSLNSVQRAYVQRNSLFRKFFFATLGANIISGLVGVYCAYYGYGVWSLAYQYFVSTIMNAAIIFFQISWKPGLLISIAKVKGMFNFGFQMILSALAYTFKDNIRQLLIGKYFSSADLGFYNQGQKFPALLVSDMIASLGQVIFPVLSREQSNRTNVKNLTREAIRYSSFIFLPVLVILFCVSDRFITVLLTEKWLASAVYLRIICIAYLNKSFSMVAMKSILAIGKSGANLIHDVIITICTIGFIFVAVFYYGSVEMVAWSYVAITIIDTIIFVVYLNRFIKYSVEEILADYVPVFLVACGAGGIVFMIGNYIETSIVNLSLQLICGVLLYLIIAKLVRLRSYIELESKALGMYKTRKSHS